MEKLSQFDTFTDVVIGDSNREAYKICNDALNGGAYKYSPIIIYGECGTGKTHLLKTMMKSLEKNCFYISGDDLIADVIDAVRNDNYREYISSLEQHEFFLIDDYHIILGKEVTQEVLFRIIEHCISTGKLIIMTSDKAIIETSCYSKNLYSRIVSGVEIELKQFDYKMRFDFLRKQAYLLGKDMANDVLQKCAKEPANAFELIGRVKAQYLEP